MALLVAGGRQKGFRLGQEKLWGSEPFWGPGYGRDPGCMSAGRHEELRATLIGRCRPGMRVGAQRSDDELKFPGRNLELPGEHGFLALAVPEEPVGR